MASDRVSAHNFQASLLGHGSKFFFAIGVALMAILGIIANDFVSGTESVGQRFGRLRMNSSHGTRFHQATRFLEVGSYHFLVKMHHGIITIVKGFTSLDFRWNGDAGRLVELHRPFQGGKSFTQKIDFVGINIHPIKFLGVHFIQQIGSIVLRPWPGAISNT